MSVKKWLIVVLVMICVMSMIGCGSGNDGGGGGGDGDGDGKLPDVPQISIDDGKITDADYEDMDNDFVTEENLDEFLSEFVYALNNDGDIKHGKLDADRNTIEDTDEVLRETRKSIFEDYSQSGDLYFGGAFSASWYHQTFAKDPENTDNDDFIDECKIIGAVEFRGNFTGNFSFENFSITSSKKDGFKINGKFVIKSGGKVIKVDATEENIDFIYAFI